MAGRGNERDPEPLDIVIGIAEIVDLDLGGIVAAGIQFADRKAPPEDGIDLAPEFPADLLEIFIAKEQVFESLSF